MELKKKVVNPVIHWRCSKCGRTADSSKRPSATYGGKCSKSTSGIHSWIKDHF